jgi:hypothetical protein
MVSGLSSVLTLVVEETIISVISLRRESGLEMAHAGRLRFRKRLQNA